MERERTSRTALAEHCVICDRDTGYAMNTPIEERDFYIEGGGQLCEECFRKLQLENWIARKES